MATLQVGEVTLGYALSGPEDGEPVVLFSGLGGPKEAWRYVLPHLESQFRVLTIDNRGTGESDKPDHQYTIAMFAADAFGLMGALGMGSAHVVGASMGGMIAQEFTLAFPHKVRSLALLCTSPGGREATPPRPEVLELWSRRQSMDPFEFEMKAAELGFSERFREAHPERIQAVVEESIGSRPPDYVFVRHAAAAMAHDAVDRLKRIMAPTLVVHGTDDWLLPHQNAEALARLIPHVRLELLEGAGHALDVERTDELVALLVDWILENSGSGEATPGV